MVAWMRWQEPLSTLNPIKFFTPSQKCHFSVVGVSKTGDNFTHFKETELISISPPLSGLSSCYQHHLASSWLRNKFCKSKTEGKAGPGSSLLCCPLWVWRTPALMPVAASCSEGQPLRLTLGRERSSEGRLQPPNLGLGGQISVKEESYRWIDVRKEAQAPGLPHIHSWGCISFRFNTNQKSPLSPSQKIWIL